MHLTKEILNWGIDNKSCNGVFRVFHQTWLTLCLSGYCVQKKKNSRALRSHLWSFILLNWHWGVPEPNHSNKPHKRTHTHTHTHSDTNIRQLATYPTQAVHQDHPDLSVVLRMSLSLWTALLTQPPNLPAAVGCLLGDARVARQGIMGPLECLVWGFALWYPTLT